MNTTSQNICQAIKKDGHKCSYKNKEGSKFCGVHKNFIDTSKSLFTEDEEEIKEEGIKEQISVHFMSGEKLNYNKGVSLQYVLDKIEKEREKMEEVYSIFEEGEEEEIKCSSLVNNHSIILEGDNYYCLIKEVAKYIEGDFLYVYLEKETDDKVTMGCKYKEIYSKLCPYDFSKSNPKYSGMIFIKYTITRRTKCFISFKRETKNYYKKDMRGKFAMSQTRGGEYVTGYFHDICPTALEFKGE